MAFEILNRKLFETSSHQGTPFLAMEVRLNAFVHGSNAPCVQFTHLIIVTQIFARYKILNYYLLVNGVYLDTFYI